MLYTQRHANTKGRMGRTRGLRRIRRDIEPEVCFSYDSLVTNYPERLDSASGSWKSPPIED